MKVPPPPEDTLTTTWRERLSVTTLDEADTFALLNDFGIPTVAANVVESAAAAVAGAQSLGMPVVLKTAAPGIAHKTDVGGVVLNLNTADQVRDAYTRVSENLGPRCVIESMAPAGVEMVFGLTTDPQFGSVVMIGAGGFLVEILRDVAHAIPPFDALEARRLIDGLRARALLDGVRGQTPVNIDVLAEHFARFSVLATTLDDVISALDVNPIIASPDGALAVDALLVTKAR